MTAMEHFCSYSSLKNVSMNGLTKKHVNVETVLFLLGILINLYFASMFFALS